jgi:Dna[CI] antecedent, DciA
MLGRYRPKSAKGPQGDIVALQAAWPAVAGAAVAANAMPLRRTRAGVVTIACSSASWAHELSAHSDRLVTGLKDATPVEVVDLRFIVADHALINPAGAPPSAPREALKAPDPDAQRRATELVGEVADDRLRDLLTRAAARTVERDSTQH